LEFFKNITTNTIVLTPNRRLSATLHKRYQQYQLDQGLTTWQTPTILPVTIWIHQLFKEYADKTFSPIPLLLNTSQELLLWEKIILSTKDNEQLLRIAETAELARSAWSLLLQWQVDIEHTLFTSGEDCAALYQWVKAYQAICEKNQWIDTAVLPHYVMEKLTSREIIAPDLIITVGFTEHSPQLKTLFESCVNSGSTLTHLDGFSEESDCKRLNALDNEQEIQAMARWAKSLYAKNPHTMIGCVLPSLDKMRDRVAQIFSEIFATDDTYTVDNQNHFFNISAGKSLSHYPVIHTALQILSIQKKTLALEIFSHLLLTPFIGEAESERIQRAHYDLTLRANNKNIIHLDALLEQDCPLLAKRFQQFLNIIADNNVFLSYTSWANQFCNMLYALGWPGERSLNSEEYQVVESWLNLLSEFETLDQVGPSVNFQQALHHLKKMATHHVFQVQSPAAPIQVLGLLEAAGMPFDYLWVAGLDDIAWPPQPKPNPLIPKRLQRDLHMPHATAERELTFCKIITEQFQQSASIVIFSHAEKREQLELQPSSLIRMLPKIALDSLALANYIPPSARIFEAREKELFIDNQAPSVLAHEKINGGASVIKQQALCPFKSFAEWRLHARAMESPLPGLRATDRGKVIHKSLELIWNALQDQATLIALDKETLNTIIQNCVESALNTIPHSHREFKQYIALEKQRLMQLMLEWLAIEKQRPPFKVVSNEKSIPFTLGSLALNVRIDRIDELQDGTALLIDYKTGKHNDINHWFGDRPEEPQLPLYSLIEPLHATSITFAQVYAGEYGFKGISYDEIDIKGVKPIAMIKKANGLSWNEQLEEWRVTLTQLSHDFYHGIASVDPKDPDDTCTWCALQPLCRINETLEVAT